MALLQQMQFDQPRSRDTDEDSRIQLQVQHQLHRQICLTEQQLRCECLCGVVVLRGQLSSFHLKQIAQESARTVPGVRRIVNLIDVIENGASRSFIDGMW